MTSATGTYPTCIPTGPAIIPSADPTAVDSPGRTFDPLTSSTKRLVDIKAALAFLSIGRTKLNELLAAGEIESVHIGRSRLIPFEALEDYVDRLRDQAGCHTQGPPLEQGRDRTSAPADAFGGLTYQTPSTASDPLATT